MTTESPEYERYVRGLRATIYGECTDKGWIACRDGWMKPDSVKWLKKEAGIAECKEAANTAKHHD